MATIKELVESEICDFFAPFGTPGAPETPAEMQQILLARVSPILAALNANPVYQYRERPYSEWMECSERYYKVAKEMNAGFTRILFTAPPEQVLSQAATDVLAERQRQQSVEGWTPAHDDAYQNSELADAAACYAIHAHNQGVSTPAHWPWSPTWWKQSGARRDLVKACALMFAEIERIDREASTDKG